VSADIYPFDVPMYAPATASRIVGLSQGRVRRWLRGYKFKYTPTGAKSPKQKKQSPVIQRGETTGLQYASFLDLIEMFFVKQFIDDPHLNLSLQKMRMALNEAKNHLGGHHHFAQRRFWTSGSEIYLLLEKQQEQDKNMVQLLSGGQRVFKDVIMKAAHHIDLDKTTEFVDRLYPLGNREPVVIDPRISFGAPTISGRRIETANIYDLFLGEGRNINRVCSWMDLTEHEVQAAVRYEKELAAA
jgi:uncharacterized protein (DUF433 family)